MNTTNPVLPPMPEWSCRDDLGGLVPSEIRFELKRYALSAIALASKEELADMEARKDAAYLERNQVVAALAKCFPSGTARTAIEGWSEDWHGCVYIDLPTGQASWHYHDSQAYLFAELPPYVGTWDGHSTEEKYERIAHLTPAAPVLAAEAVSVESIDNNEFNALIEKMCDEFHNSIPPYLAARKQVIEHISAWGTERFRQGWGEGMQEAQELIAADDAVIQPLGEWAECERISNLPAVDDALHGFSEDPTGDNGICVVRAICAAIPPTAPATPSGMPVTQEPKYGIRENRLYNRASGEFIPEDEPVFIFRARDCFARQAIAEYFTLLTNEQHCSAVYKRIKDFRLFSEVYPERMKEPDTIAASQATQPEAGPSVHEAEAKLLKAAKAFAKEHIEGDALHESEASDEVVHDADERYNETKRLLCDAYLELAAKTSQAQPKAAPSDEQQHDAASNNYCLKCEGEGVIHSGIDESPTTMCNTCEGTGLAKRAAVVAQDADAYELELFNQWAGPRTENEAPAVMASMYWMQEAWMARAALTTQAQPALSEQAKQPDLETQPTGSYVVDLTELERRTLRDAARYLAQQFYVPAAEIIESKILARSTANLVAASLKEAK